jgi:hypothetical protein
MSRSNSQNKQGVIAAVSEAYEWGDRWNELIPKDVEHPDDIVRFSDGMVVVPSRFAGLFQVELREERNRQLIGTMDDGDVFIRLPREASSERGPLSTGFVHERLTNGVLVRQPILEFER